VFSSPFNQTVLSDQRNKNAPSGVVDLPNNLSLKELEQDRQLLFVIDLQSELILYSVWQLSYFW
jgi:isochorismate hydrolase